MSHTLPMEPKARDRSSGDPDDGASNSPKTPSCEARADQAIDDRGRETVPDDYMSPWLARGLDAYDHSRARAPLPPQAYLPRPAGRASPFMGDARTLGRACVATARRIIQHGQVVGASKDERGPLAYLAALFAQVGAEPGWHQELFGRGGRGLTIPNRVVIARVAHRRHIPGELLPLLSPHVDFNDLWVVYRMRPNDMPAASFLAGDALRLCACESAAESAPDLACAKSDPAKGGAHE